MSLFKKCQHQWGRMTYKFSSPRGPLNNFRAESSPEAVEMMKSILYGITTVTQQCEKCGMARSYTTPGAVD